MNIEMFFIRSDQPVAVAELVKSRLSASVDAPGEQPDWGIPSSYDQVLAFDPKRKVALSDPVEGWIAGIESKEVVDFALLKNVSHLLKTTAIIIQISDVAECSGYVVVEEGEKVESHFSEDDSNPIRSIRGILKAHGIVHDLVLFREIVQLKGKGWVII